MASAEGLPALRARLGDSAQIQGVAFGKTTSVNGVAVSLHPAGHILGSAQVRIAYRGEVWVVSGDYKTEPDPTCTPFEAVPCHTFITEATFGLPIYRWPAQAVIFEGINAWWQNNRDRGRPSVLLGYALGKAQRLLAGVDAGIGPLFAHGAVRRMNEAYRESGVPLPEARSVEGVDRDELRRGLIVAPPSVRGSPWLRRFPDPALAFASGWMQVRGQRRRRSLGGFVLSDHVDWRSLLSTVQETGAERVLVTHGYAASVARYLREQGLDAAVLETRFGDEEATDQEDQTSDDG